MPRCGSILQAETCQIFSIAGNPRWSRVWQKIRKKNHVTRKEKGKTKNKKLKMKNKKTKDEKK